MTAASPIDRSAIVGWLEQRMRKHGVSQTSFGLHALGDPGFMRRLKGEGSNVGLRTLERAFEFADDAEKMNAAAGPKKVESLL